MEGAQFEQSRPEACQHVEMWGADDLLLYSIKNLNQLHLFHYKNKAYHILYYINTAYYIYIHIYYIYIKHMIYNLYFNLQSIDYH